MVQFLDGSFLDILLFGILPALVIAAIIIYKMKSNKKNKESED